MHAISSYRGNRPTHHPSPHTQTHPQTGPITIHCAAASAQCNECEFLNIEAGVLLYAVMECDSKKFLTTLLATGSTEIAALQENASSFSHLLHPAQQSSNMFPFPRNARGMNPPGPCHSPSSRSSVVSYCSRTVALACRVPEHA